MYAIFFIFFTYFFFFQSGSKSQAYLKPIILEEILQSHKQRVSEIVASESQLPMAHTKLYDKYSFLINKQVKPGYQ